MPCIVPGCRNRADKKLGIRLRRPRQIDRASVGTAIWAPETGAFICDQHAAAGWRITIVMEPTTSGEVATKVICSNAIIRRRTRIKNRP
jgi:hypothetical protein